MGEIPEPTRMWFITGKNGGWLVSYDIEGPVNARNKSQGNYLSDIGLRFVQTFNAILMASEPFTDAMVDNGRRYDLSEVAKNLQSLKNRSATFQESKRLYTGKEDRLFWTAKEWCEITLKRGLQISEFEIKQVILFAGGTYSEAKAKAKSIYGWYKENNFRTSSRVHEMTRVENAKKQAQEIAKRTREKVRTVAITFVNLNQKITAKAVGEAAQVDQRTASKYLKEMKNEGLI